MAAVAAQRQSKPQTRRDDIQGIRGISVGLVVLYHAGLGFPGGFVGVDVFFVVSGFVITRGLHSELKTSGRISLANFYRRRVRRILPASAVTVAVTCLLAMVLSPLRSQALTARTGISATLLNANSYLALTDTRGYFDATSAHNALLHSGHSL